MSAVKHEDDDPKWIEISEHNDWEGETWYHFFSFSEDHYHVLEQAIAEHKDDGSFFIRQKTLSWQAAEDLTNRDDGSYMQKYWFGELTRADEILRAESLYKGRIRKYGEELFSYEDEALVCTETVP